MAQSVVTAVSKSVSGAWKCRTALYNHDLLYTYIDSFPIGVNGSVGSDGNLPSRTSPSVSPTDHRAPAVRPIQCLVMLNSSSMCSRMAVKLWNKFSYRVCADGACNRLYQTLNEVERNMYIPDAICGDLDSALPAVLDFYRFDCWYFR
jgi:hypothetical protein